MSPEAALKHIFITYGRNLLQEPKRIEHLLKDLCPRSEDRREIDVLMLSLKEKIPSELLMSSPIDELKILQLVKRLLEASFVPKDVAIKAIRAWGNALGLAIPEVVPQVATAVPWGAAITPKRSAATQQAAAVAPPAPILVYSPDQMILATVMGTPLAGAYFLKQNYIAIGDSNGEKKARLIGVFSLLVEGSFPVVSTIKIDYFLFFMAIWIGCVIMILEMSSKFFEQFKFTAQATAKLKSYMVTTRPH